MNSSGISRTQFLGEPFVNRHGRPGFLFRGCFVNLSEGNRLSLKRITVYDRSYEDALEQWVLRIAELAYNGWQLHPEHREALNSDHRLFIQDYGDACASLDRDTGTDAGYRRRSTKLLAVAEKHGLRSLASDEL